MLSLIYCVFIFSLPLGLGSLLVPQRVFEQNPLQDMVIINSFNDFAEQTAVEPTRRGGGAPGPPDNCAGDGGGFILVVDCIFVVDFVLVVD